MRRTIIAAAALLSAGLLSACESGGSSGVYYEGYYDNFYGPVRHGYWDNDVFYYRNLHGRTYLRDDARHFRRDRVDGWREFRMHDGRGRNLRH